METPQIRSKVNLISITRFNIVWQMLDKDIEREESMGDLSSEGHGEAVVPKDPNGRRTLDAPVSVQQ